MEWPRALRSRGTSSSSTAAGRDFVGQRGPALVRVSGNGRQDEQKILNFQDHSSKEVRAARRDRRARTVSELHPALVTDVLSLTGCQPTGSSPWVGLEVRSDGTGARERVGLLHPEDLGSCEKAARVLLLTALEPQGRSRRRPERSGGSRRTTAGRTRAREGRSAGTPAAPARPPLAAARGAGQSARARRAAAPRGGAPRAIERRLPRTQPGHAGGAGRCTTQEGMSRKRVGHVGRPFSRQARAPRS